MIADQMNNDADNIKRFSESINKAMDDMGKNASTPEEKFDADAFKKSLAGTIYSSIVEGVAEILKSQSIINIITEISKSIGKDNAVHLTELFAIAMVNSSFHAITVYDEHLKDQLAEHDKEINEILTTVMADVQGHTMAIKQIRDHLNIDPK